MRITSEQQLRKIYKQPKGRAVTKQLDHLDQHTLSFINLSPFCIVATYGEVGLADATPRGGKPGFVQCPNDKTLLIPDWPGNNRVDSLKKYSLQSGYWPHFSNSWN